MAIFKPLLTLAATAALLTGCAATDLGDGNGGGDINRADAAAIVNGEAIPRAAVQRVLAANPSLADDPRGQAIALNTLINREIVLQEARRQNLRDDPRVDQAIAAATEEILVNALLNQYLRSNPIDETAVRNRYQEMVSGMPNREFRLRHIVLPSQEEAAQVLDRLRGGASFGSLLSRSLDRRSAARGGELGWVSPLALSPSLTRELLNARTGQYLGPVQLGPGGWSIIQLQDTRRASPPEIAEIADEIRNQLRQETLQQYLRQLREQAEIETLTQ